MKITILGATGNVGSATMREAVAAGHEVVAYVRRPDAVEKLPGVTVVAGDVDDPIGLAAAIRGADAVIAAVTGPTKDTTFTQRTLPAIVAAMEQAGVARLVQVSAFGVGDTADKASWLARLIYAPCSASSSPTRPPPKVSSRIRRSTGSSSTRST